MNLRTRWAYATALIATLSAQGCSKKEKPPAAPAQNGPVKMSTYNPNGSEGTFKALGPQALQLPLDADRLSPERAETVGFVGMQDIDLSPLVQAPHPDILKAKKPALYAKAADILEGLVEPQLDRCLSKYTEKERTLFKFKFAAVIAAGLYPDPMQKIEAIKSDYFQNNSQLLDILVLVSSRPESTNNAEIEQVWGHALTHAGNQSEAAYLEHVRNDALTKSQRILPANWSPAF